VTTVRAVSVQSQDIEYSFEGTKLVGELSADDAVDGARPGVLVCHEGNGLTDHAKMSARRLAELGYIAFALDYYGDGKPLPPEQVMERLGPLMGDPLRIRAIGTAGLEVLLADPRADHRRVAAIGYCFGGTMSLELARGGTDLTCVVGFHSGLQTTRPEDASNILAKILVCIGTEDPLIPPDQRAAFEQEMRAGGADWRMHLYGGCVHSFTNPAADGSNPAIRYDPLADARSWRAMLDLFREVF
jgi:dienelactone hydrolase